MADVTIIATRRAMQAAFVQRSKFQLIDSVDYFYSKLDELAATNYVPTIEDVIKTRVRTTGIIGASTSAPASALAAQA
ncbi:hypothetical protein EON66_03580 [archaeon]|nr:MAG: hypothetical protein EON66_03580 [archaeon]